MRTIFALQVAVLLFLSMGSIAADVEYQHPDLTIVANEEPLQSVLKSVGKEMRIFITTPTGINPVVSCDIQKQPIKLAFKKLLGNMSYSLEWEDGGERLVGLTLLAGGEGVATASGRSSHTQTVEQAVPVASGDNRPPVEQSPKNALDATATMADHDAEMAGHEADMEAEGEERETQMAEEREAHEAEMVIRQQEQEIAHEERMKEEEARIEAEAATHLAAEGIEP